MSLEINDILDLKGDVNAASVQKARRQIAEARQEKLAPEQEEAFRAGLNEMIDISPAPETTAAAIQSWLADESRGLIGLWNHLRNACMLGRGGRSNVTAGNEAPSDGSKDRPATSGDERQAAASPGRPSTNHIHERDRGLCRISGESTMFLEVCHIVPFALQAGMVTKSPFLGLLRMYLGADKTQRLVTFLQQSSTREGGRSRTNLNGWINLVTMTLHVHRAFDQFLFTVDVMWDTYDQTTGEFDANVRWAQEEPGIMNFWDPHHVDGILAYARMKNGTKISFRRIDPKHYLLPSPVLFGLHRLVAHVARMVGAAGLDNTQESWSSDFGLIDEPLESEDRVSKWLEDLDIRPADDDDHDTKLPHR